MEKTIENLKSEIANLSKRQQEGPHIISALALLGAAVERLGVHVETTAPAPAPETPAPSN